MQDIVKYMTTQKNENIEEIKDDLFYDFADQKTTGAKLSEEDFLEGFWYNGQNGLLFFDVNQLIKNGYTKEEIANLIKEILKDGKIWKKDSINVLSEDDLNDDLKFHNKIYQSSAMLDNSYSKIKDELKDKEKKTAIDYYRLSEIYSFQGDYKESKRNLDEACELDKDFCKTNLVKVSGKVIDGSNKAVRGVVVTLLSTGKATLTNAKGEYAFDLNLVKLKKERLSFEKEGYSTTFISVTNNSEYQKEIRNTTVDIVKSSNKFTLNNINNTIDNNGEFKDNKFILKTNTSTYYIPRASFVDKNGNVYKGEIEAYLFDFDRYNAPQSLLSLDSFSSDKNFLGTSMITFGMPYIIFRTPDGERIDIKKSNPMILETKSEILKSMFNSPKLSEDVRKEIIKNSQKGEYYYTVNRIIDEYAYLIPFWVLDQRTGVWENTGIDIVNGDEGIQRSIFYTTI